MSDIDLQIVIWEKYRKVCAFKMAYNDNSKSDIVPICTRCPVQMKNLDCKISLNNSSEQKKHEVSWSSEYFLNGDEEVRGGRKRVINLFEINPLSFNIDIEEHV